MHLTTRLVCCEIIYTSFEKVRDFFSKILIDLGTENEAKLPRKI